MEHLKRMARKKVQAGVRLLMAEPIVGLLYLMPKFPRYCPVNLHHHHHRHRHRHRHQLNKMSHRMIQYKQNK